MFRLLKANEIDVRIGTSKKNNDKVITGASYLLYKDARVDMTLLDETYGEMNWQRKHEFKDGKLYCSVGIYDLDKKQWVWKEDVGVESLSEAEKGQASDSFKRACFNWGIGRELYTSPFIWINALPNEDLAKVKMRVDTIEYDKNRNIVNLVIVDNKNNVRFEMYNQPKQQPLNQNLVNELLDLGGTLQMVADYYKKNIEELNDADVKKLVDAKKRQLGKTPKQSEKEVKQEIDEIWRSL